MEHQIEKIIYDETEKRLHEMERKTYIFPPAFGKADWVAIAVCLFISFGLIGLCMTGVIV